MMKPRRTGGRGFNRHVGEARDQARFFFLPPPPIAVRQRALTLPALRDMQALSCPGSAIDWLHSRMASPWQAAFCAADHCAAAGSGDASRARPKMATEATIKRFTIISFSLGCNPPGGAFMRVD